MSKRAHDRPEHSPSSTDAALPFVRASDLGTWAYCNRAWWLARVQNLEPTNRSLLDGGTQVHEDHARSVARGRWAVRAGALLLLVALLTLALLLVQALVG